MGLIAKIARAFCPSRGGRTDTEHVMNETFSIEFDGAAFDNHEIPAAALAQSLFAVDDLAKRAAKALYGKSASAEIRVKAGFKPGSFILDLVAACENHPSETIATVSVLVTISGGVVSTLKELYRLGKFSKGRRIETEPDGSNPDMTRVFNEFGQVMQFSNCTVNLYNQERTQSLLSRSTQTLDKEGVDSISIFDDSADAERVVISKSDREYFRQEEGTVLTDNETEVVLEVVGAMTNGSPKGWKFSEGEDGIEFVASVEDEEFLAKVRSREIKFENGTAIRAILRTTQTKTVRTRTNRVIVEVRELLSPALELF